MRKQMIFVLAVILSLSFSNFASTIDDPVAHWKLDETSGLIAEDSAGDNDGTLVNGPIWMTGWIDGGLEFDNVDDYVDVGDPADESLDFGADDSFSIAAWIKCDDIGGHSAIVAKRRCTGLYGYFYEGYGFRVHQDILYFGIEDTGNNGVGMFGSTPVTDNIWHHVAAVRDATANKLYLYVDGNSDAEPVTDSTSSSLSTTQELWIGLHRTTVSNDPLENPHYFSGKIDDVRIYDRALSAAEIEELYLGEEPELVGLEITGPDEAAENSQTQYSAIALYDNDSTADVTDDALWSVEPNVIAGIEAGLLTTEKIFQPEELQIVAQYTEDGNTFDANKPVSVFAICPSGTALDFDGVNDYVDVNPVGELDFERTQEYTLSAWYKGVDEKHAILSKMDKSIGYRGYDMFIDYGYVQAHIINNWPSNAIRETGALYPINDYIWHHIAITYDGSSSANGLKIYVDGMEETTTVEVDSLSSTIQNSVSFKIAARSDGTSTSAHLGGTIDDVRVYNRALSAQEIQMSMHVPLEVDEPNLVGYWDFDEGTGQVAHDTSGSGNDGQLGTSADIDDSDPNWVDSDAPIGICTLEELVERNVNEALEIKLNILDEILEALAREDASVNILDGLFGELEYGYLDRRDIGRAGQEIHSAIQSEEQAIHSVQKSVGDLEDSLEILGSEDGPPDSNSPNDSRLMKRLLIPLKK